ncbi:MAG: ribitol-5-phosphate dehydrogenase [Ruminococcus sp.]|nr:ribitol-5-phosphate dehydrogenase [Ruminococcus sp.]
MIALQYKLVKPFVIETAYNDLSLGEGVIVRPKFLSVCKADMRYFFGQRNPDILRKRLPLSLIHEACGEVLYDPAGTFDSKQKVILLPNIPGKDEYYAENYRLDSRFRSSRADGFMQELMAVESRFLLPYSDKLPDEIAAFTEFISVGIHAVNTFIKRAGNRRDHIAVWGDGALSYVVCSILKCLLPETVITVIGVNPTKLQYFTFVDNTLTVNEVHNRPEFDHCFECVGGSGSAAAISQIIDNILPEGVVTLLGVSEDAVPINTRMVLELGLTLIGRSRSGRTDFEKAVELLETKPSFTAQMKHMISHVVKVQSINDIRTAFDMAKTADFKVIIQWDV